MAQVLVRELKKEVVERHKKRAKAHGRSLQFEVKTILEEAVSDYEAVWKRIERFRKKLRQSGRTFCDSAELIRSDRERDESLCRGCQVVCQQITQKSEVCASG